MREGTKVLESRQRWPLALTRGACQVATARGSVCLSCLLAIAGPTAVVSAVSLPPLQLRQEPGGLCPHHESRDDALRRPWWGWRACKGDGVLLLPPPLLHWSLAARCPTCGSAGAQPTSTCPRAHPLHAAPPSAEVMLNVHRSAYDGMKADVWSCGVSSSGADCVLAKLWEGPRRRRSDAR